MGTATLMMSVILAVVSSVVMVRLMVPRSVMMGLRPRSVIVIVRSLSVVMVYVMSSLTRSVMMGTLLMVMAVTLLV